MAADKKYYWLKLRRDFFKRHDIRIIKAMPNGTEYVLFYLQLLVESIDHDGRLRFSDRIPYDENMLATITDTNIDTVRAAMQIFAELGLVEIMDDRTIFMNECQKLLGAETEWAEKKRKQRAMPQMENGSKRLNGEMLQLPNGEHQYIDEKRYGGNGMKAFDRAFGKCEMCGAEGGAAKLLIHHNNGYSNELDDLYVLCSKCHGIVHSKEYGGQVPQSVHHLSSECPLDVR